jgi:XTP/dITP diphosphohydrolase
LTNEGSGARGRARLVVATHNPGKRGELERLLRGGGVELQDLGAYPSYTPPVEDADTYEGNALRKAAAAAQYTGFYALADDSGLEVEALEGRPGVHSARYGGEGLDDVGRIRLLLQELKDVPPARRGAWFVCVLVVAGPDGRAVLTSRARLWGRVTTQPKGHGGFGYDPVFYVPSLGCTLAELAPSAKDAVSHRGRAAAQLVPALRRWALDPDRAGS